MKLLVQEYLLTHSFGELAREHGVYASFNEAGYKFSLNYDQIEAKESDPLAQECRGLILAQSYGSFIVSRKNASPLILDRMIPGHTTILAYPMKRFFNHGQGAAAQINWSDNNLAILEKLDGTLCIVYWDKFTNQWCVATRSVPEADLTMDNGLFTFRTLFEKAVKDTIGISFFNYLRDDDSFVKRLNHNYTYCFELTTPYNRIVVNYPTCSFTLLAVRNMQTMQEEDPAPIGQAIGIPVAQSHTSTSVEELVNWVSSLNPMEHEGVVVRDGQFNRIKVKNAAYVAYNKVRDALASSERNIMELILLEKEDDVIPMLPEEIVKNLQRIKLGLQRFIVKYDETYKTIYKFSNEKAPNDKKSFALLCQSAANSHKLWTPPMFQMFDGKASNMKDFIMKNKKGGGWGNSFLDKVLELSKLFSND